MPEESNAESGGETPQEDVRQNFEQEAPDWAVDLRDGLEAFASESAESEDERAAYEDAARLVTEYWSVHHE